MILSDFGGPGAHFGGLGAHFEDTSDFCDFGDTSATKPYSLFEVIVWHFLTFFAFCVAVFSAWIVDRLDKRFLMIFGRFWGAFGRLFWSFFRPEREHKKVCLDCTGVCGLHIQLSGKCTFSQLFPFFFLKPCAGGHFSRFVRFCALLRLPVWHLLAPVVVKKQVWKNGAKKCSKTGTRKAQVTGCGPLKNKQIPTIRPRTCPGVPGGTVADLKPSYMEIQKNRTTI